MDIPEAEGRRGELPMLRRAGLTLLVEATLFLSVISICTAIAPNHDTDGHTLSRLGVLPATATLFNLSLIVLGFFNCLTAYFFHHGNAGQSTVLVLALAGIGAAGSGLIHVDVDRSLHAILASIGFLGHVSMPFVLARSASGAMRLMSYVAGFLSLAFLLVWVVGLSGEGPAFGVFDVGEPQRVVLYVLIFWTMAFGGYLMARERPRAHVAEW